MVERRRGNETGVSSVQCLEGEDVWQWLAGDPVHAGLARSAGQALRGSAGPWEQAPQYVPHPAAFLVEYRDGLWAVVLMLDGYSTSFAFAGQAEGRLETCEFVLQKDGPHGHFCYLGLNVEEMFVTGQPTYPVERTLLTTGVLAAAMDSRHLGHIRVETPHLDVRYSPPAGVPYRPQGPAPAGATLDPWPPIRARPGPGG